ncbi:hypothetical protein F4780DRAFT_780076 [Xylariomycetidae sp. FL0641]|nr:hypothetical protein F4780DRAFT_780076 [Xylariomycetidae sp. FL0641]
MDSAAGGSSGVGAGPSGGAGANNDGKRKHMPDNVPVSQLSGTSDRDGMITSPSVTGQPDRTNFLTRYNQSVIMRTGGEGVSRGQFLRNLAADGKPYLGRHSGSGGVPQIAMANTPLAGSANRWKKYKGGMLDDKPADNPESAESSEPAKKKKRTNRTGNGPNGFEETPVPEFGAEITCGGCGKTGHSLAVCAGPPDRGGQMRGCAFCNTKKHFLDKCPHFLGADPEKLRQILLGNRAGRPAFRTRKCWLKLAVDQGIPPIDMYPLRNHVATLLAEEHKQFYEEWDYDNYQASAARNPWLALDRTRNQAYIKEWVNDNGSQAFQPGQLDALHEEYLVFKRDAKAWLRWQRAPQ